MTKRKSVKRLLYLVSSVLVLSGCDWKDLIPIYGWLPEHHDEARTTHRERVISDKVILALGGTRSTEYIFSTAITDVVNNDADLFTLSPRDGFSTIAEGQGVKITPLHEGIGYITPQTASGNLPAVEVTIPPQKLIQIFMGEARGELSREATLEDGHVKSTSVSVTGNALGSVIRNRIRLINESGEIGNPHLFVVDPTEYSQNPAISYYEGVIDAHSETLYQFSPVDPDDPSHDEFVAASTRAGVSEDLKISYDQAVLTAGGVFNESTDDPTSESFAFYSPTPEQFALLNTALQNGTTQLPENCGISDGNFPAFSPIQVYVLPEIASSPLHTDVPSFVFIRARSSTDPAVAGAW